MWKKIVLCADDFGYSEHVSRAILKLAQNKCISSTSCITDTSDWVAHGPSLKDLHDQIDIGLHFNLTEGLYNLNRLLIRSVIGLIDKKLIEEQLNKQLDSFIEVIGREPDFIDGHQHVHTFPVIRDILVKVIKARFKHKNPYVRTITPMLSAYDSKLKSIMLSSISSGFSRLLDNKEISYNYRFGGIYNFNPDPGQYRKFMIKWLTESIKGTIIMCHPGGQSTEHNSDSIAYARVQECEYLLSDDFQKDLISSGVMLSKFNQI